VVIGIKWTTNKKKASCLESPKSGKSRNHGCFYPIGACFLVDCRVSSPKKRAHFQDHILTLHAGHHAHGCRQQIGHEHRHITVHHYSPLHVTAAAFSHAAVNYFANALRVAIFALAVLKDSLATMYSLLHPTALESGLRAQGSHKDTQEQQSQPPQHPHLQQPPQRPLQHATTASVAATQDPNVDEAKGASRKEVHHWTHENPQIPQN
jgi:hypothetical protein